MTPVSEDIASQEYLRQRLQPQPGDPLYLVLSDLLIALRELIPPGVSRVLDYGSGGSPYKPLFKDCTYHRADLAGQNNLDFEYGPDARLPESVHGYDFILSTQVLEHVASPTIYLDECHRVLSPNGHLLLTTHGIFEDHGCPYDYWRWTIYGLGKIVERAGFKIKALKKITTGPRAAVFLAEQQFQTFRSSLTGPYGTVISLGIRAVQRIGSRRLHNVCDTSFKGWRVVDAEEAGHSTYIVIGVLAARR
jgi:SAM-dependent methyltransferase